MPPRFKIVRPARRVVTPRTGYFPVRPPLGVLSGNSQQRFTVITEQANDLVCRALGSDGTQGTEDISVAKPYPLRGDVATRTVSGEDQVITPSYVTEPIIFGFVPAGGTGVDDVAWQQVGDGRFWAMECDE